MAKAKSLDSQRFGRLLVLSRNYEKQKQVFDDTGQYKAYWNCLCDCGAKVIVSSNALQNKTNPTRSCGCLKDETKHRSKNTKTNKWIIKDDIAIGVDSNGKQFIIDAADYHLAKNYCWYVNPHNYVTANTRNGSNFRVALHRLLMQPVNAFVDHKNRNRLDNRRANLRIATKSQNNINIPKKSNNTSGYTGVTKNCRGKFIARISMNGKRYYLGTFDSYEEACKVRKEAEQRLHGEWSGSQNEYGEIAE